MADNGFLQKRATEMRRAPTDAEKYLWRYLSNSKLGGFKFRRQTLKENRIGDFFCPSKGLIVEVDGHTHDREKDMIDDAKFESETGFGTFRVTNEDVMTNMDGVLETILAALESRPDRWQK